MVLMYRSFVLLFFSVFTGAVTDGLVGYDIILIAGQSNAVGVNIGGLDEAFLDKPHPDVLMFGSLVAEIQNMCDQVPDNIVVLLFSCA